MKERLDVLLVNKGLAASREKAKAVIMAGIVYVDGQKEDKAGSTFDSEKAVEEANSLGIKFEQIFVQKEKASKYSNFKNIILANEAVMKKISTTDTAPDIIAVAHQLSFTAKDFAKKSKIVLLENIKDSGNLGTIIRTCTALGIDGLILSGETADIYNPKTVRSAVGNLFKIPFINIKSTCVTNN